ncbi:Fic family protein [Brevundimonas diminuta]|uniref:Fic family protein n=1 Tax=Brevundimonas diminuta TaxID=293 RepID=UPI0030F5BE83
MADIFFTGLGDETQDRKIRRDHAAGKLQRLANGIYIKPSGESVNVAILRNWPKIAARLIPDGVVTDRSGIEAQPWRDRSEGAPKGDAILFMSAPRSRTTITLPGLVINVREGAGPMDEDIPYLGTHLAGEARRLLDNMARSRARSGPARTVGPAEVEKRLDSLCTTHGVHHLNSIRDKARQLAPLIDREEEFAALNTMISTLLRTREGKALTPQGRARSDGHPVDPACVGRLVKLVEFMQARSPFTVTNPDTSPERRRTASFMEAYFSNFIEGTEFAVGEAVEIVFEGRVPEARPEDGHDILGAYLQLVDLGERSALLTDPAAFIDEIRERHRQLMAQRPSVQPGIFKIRPNQAGNTAFVHPDLVLGTLREGVDILRSISDPFSRGIFVHFLLADVHPFNDGNGRISRIMMTKELLAAGLSRIIIPTVFRSDYFDALRALSRRDDPSIFVRSLEFCQKTTAACSADTTAQAIESWARAYGFCEDSRHARLSLPNPAREIETRDGIPAPSDYWAAITGDDDTRLLP